jgi:hypothetical protein
MGEPAPNKPNNPLAIEGLEEVFESSEDFDLTSEVCRSGSEDFGTVDGSTSEVFGIAREILTTTEAAARLGISPRAVINRLKVGTLAGERAPGRFKEEWRVFWTELPNTSEVSTSEPPDASEPVKQTSEVRSETSEEIGSHARPTTELSSGQQIFSELLAAHTEQIKTQNELIKYLAEQLKERDSQIKLLTDSQHKPGWWQRFSSWFVGK